MNVERTTTQQQDAGGGGEGACEFDDDLDIKGRFEDKRNAHTAAEQKRRNAIKNALEQLHHLIPGCNQTDLPTAGIISKTSKAQVLQKAIDYVNYMQRDRGRKKQEIAELEKKLAALKIMKDNYELLVKSSDEPVKAQISDEVKFTVFKHIMTNLWETFNSSVAIDTFQTLSGSVISWLEECCKPEAIKNVIMKAIHLVLR